MIRRVRGELLSRGPERVEVLTASGVGYELHVPARLVERLPEEGARVELHAALVVRDDALELFGFGSGRDRELFLRLQAASGVGPRLALALIGALPPARLVRAIRDKDHAVLRTVSGVGRKTAERIALELADKLDDLVGPEEETAVEGHFAAAVRALVALGYAKREAEEAVGDALGSFDGDEPGTEDVVRRALRRL